MDTDGALEAMVGTAGGADEALSIEALTGLLGDLAPEPEPERSAAELGKYRVLRRTLVRDGHEAFSSVLGALEAGEVVEIVEEQVLEIGAGRLRFERTVDSTGPAGGWVSATGPTGQAFLVPLGDAAEAELQAESSAEPAPSAATATSADSPEALAAGTAAEPKKGSWFGGWGSSTATEDGDADDSGEAEGAEHDDGPVVPVERVRMVSVVTRTDKKGKQYTAFGITVFPLPVATSGGEGFETAEEWVVYRRFSDFVELRTKLITIDKQAFEGLEFPSQRVTMFSNAAKVNTGRRLALERWLTEVLARPTSNEVVSRFAAQEAEKPPAPETPTAAPEPASSATDAVAAADAPAAAEPAAAAAEQRTWRVRKVKMSATAASDDEQGLAGAKEDTAYTVHVYPREEGGTPWEVPRRYSEFCTLRAALRASCGAVLRSNDRVFPVDRVWSRKQLDTKAADERLAALQIWMDNVVGLRPDEPKLVEFISPVVVGKEGDATASVDSGADAVAGGEAGADQAAWGASLTSLLAAPASGWSFRPTAMLGAGGDDAAAEAAVESTPAGRELPVPLDALWEATEKFVTPFPPGGNSTGVTYPAPAAVVNAYEVAAEGLLPPPLVELYRVTHEHRPGLGFQPLVVERASITGIATKYSGGGKAEFTVYTLYCQPREGFGWTVSKRFSDFVALRTALGAVEAAVLALEFPAKWFPGMMLGSEETQK